MRKRLPIYFMVAFMACFSVSCCTINFCPSAESIIRGYITIHQEYSRALKQVAVGLDPEGKDLYEKYCTVVERTLVVDAPLLYYQLKHKPQDIKIQSGAEPWIECTFNDSDVGNDSDAVEAIRKFRDSLSRNRSLRDEISAEDLRRCAKIWNEARKSLEGREALKKQAAQVNNLIKEINSL